MTAERNASAVSVACKWASQWLALIGTLCGLVLLFIVLPAYVLLPAHVWARIPLLQSLPDYLMTSLVGAALASQACAWLERKLAKRESPE